MFTAVQKSCMKPLRPQNFRRLWRRACGGLFLISHRNVTTYWDFESRARCAPTPPHRPDDCDRRAVHVCSQSTSDLTWRMLS
eukprot:6921863-Prymnesium_polylepis.2